VKKPIEEVDPFDILSQELTVTDNLSVVDSESSILSSISNQ